MASTGLYRAYAALLVGALVPIVAGSRSSLVVRRPHSLANQESTADP